MKKRCMSLVLILILTVMSFGNSIVFASTNEESLIDAYASSVVTAYLHANGLSDNNAYLSQAYSVYNTNNTCISHYMYFVLSESKVVGRLSVNEYDGDYVSSFTCDSVELFTNTYNNNSDFLLYVSGESLFMRTDNTDVFISGTGEDSVVEDVVIPIEKQYLESDCLIVSRPKSRANVNYQLNVPYVANNTVNGVGICWTASVAARVNYHKGTSHTALTVFNSCLNSTLSSRPTGTPAGYSNWVQFAYSLYGINTTCVESGKMFSEICILLSNNKPIYCKFDRVGGAHAVLLIGVYQDSGMYTTYTFRDPNVSSTVSIVVSYNALTTPSLVVYSNGQQTYYTWASSIY